MPGIRRSRPRAAANAKRIGRGLLMGSFASGVGARLVRATRGSSSLRAVIYHDIPDDELDTLRAHIERLSASHRFIAASEFVAIARGERPLEGHNLLVTFDDGYASQAEAARAVLDPAGVKALFFLIPGLLDCETSDEAREFAGQHLYRQPQRIESLPAHLAPMRWAQAAELVQQGHAIGAHSMSHSALSLIGSQDRLRHEIAGSGNVLSSRLGTPVDCFAFPFGTVRDIGRPAMHIVRERYAACFSAVRGGNRGVHPYAITRETVSLQDPLGSLAFIAGGGLAPLYAWKARRLRALAE